MFRVDQQSLASLHDLSVDQGRLLLLKELTARKNRNPSYSLRAFARDLGVSPAALSQYLARKRELSKKNRQSVIEKMRLSPTEQESLWISARPNSTVKTTYGQIAEDTFRIISDWVSLATLNLAHLKSNKADAGWIAKRLGIPSNEAKDTLNRLVRVGLLEIKSGKMHRTTQSFATTTDIPSEAIKRFHLGVIRKAEQALLDLPVDKRDITAITMPTDPLRLEEAKKILVKTRRQIADLVSKGEPSEVYVLAMQFFPFTQQDSESKR